MTLYLTEKGFYNKRTFFYIFCENIIKLHHTDAGGAVLAELVAGVAVADEAAVAVDAHAGRAALRPLLALVHVGARVGAVVRRRRAPVSYHQETHLEKTDQLEWNPSLSACSNAGPMSTAGPMSKKNF